VECNSELSTFTSVSTEYTRIHSIENALPRSRQEISITSYLRQRQENMPPRRQRNSRSRPGTVVEVQFVNVVPNDENGKTSTQSVVRANAAHFHWRHNRPPQDRGKQTQKITQVAPTLHSSRAKHMNVCPPQAIKEVSLQSSAPLYIENGEFKSQEELESSSSLSLANKQPSFEEVDPFSTYDCDLPREFVSRCITFSK